LNGTVAIKDDNKTNSTQNTINSRVFVNPFTGVRYQIFDNGTIVNMETGYVVFRKGSLELLI